MSLPLNQKPEMTELSEEGWDRQRARALEPVSQIVNAKEILLKEIRSASPMNTWMMRKLNSLIADMEEVLVVWNEDQIQR